MFEWNLDFTADGRSYWFQGNEKWWTDLVPGKTHQEIMPKLLWQKLMLSPLMPLELCRGADICLHPDILKVKNSLKLQKGSHTLRYKPLCSLPHSTATSIPQMSYWQFFSSAAVRQTKPVCPSSHCKHLNIHVLWKSIPIYSF